MDAEKKTAWNEALNDYCSEGDTTRFMIYKLSVFYGMQDCEKLYRTITFLDTPSEYANVGNYQKLNLTEFFCREMRKYSHASTAPFSFETLTKWQSVWSSMYCAGRN
jgi:hypothetical protein